MNGGPISRPDGTPNFAVSARERRVAGRRPDRIVGGPSPVEAIESLSVGEEIASALRRRASALAGVDLVVELSPPALEVRTATAPLLRRALSLLVGALAARPAIDRLEVVAQSVDEAHASPRLRVSMRAVGSGRVSSGSHFDAVVRRLLDRAEAIARFHRGLLVRDDSHAGELRCCLEVEAIALREESALRRGSGSGTRVALLSADSRRLDGWARALRAAGVGSLRCGGAGELLRQTDPTACSANPPDWVVVDDSLAVGSREAFEALRAALEAAGIARERILRAASALREGATCAALESRDLPAPVLGRDLVRIVLGSSGADLRSGARCGNATGSSILASPIPS